MSTYLPADSARIQRGVTEGIRSPGFRYQADAEGYGRLAGRAHQMIRAGRTDQLLTISVDDRRNLLIILSEVYNNSIGHAFHRYDESVLHRPPSGMPDRLNVDWGEIRNLWSALNSSLDRHMQVAIPSGLGSRQSREAPSYASPLGSSFGSTIGSSGPGLMPVSDPRSLIQEHAAQMRARRSGPSGLPGSSYRPFEPPRGDAPSVGSRYSSPLGHLPVVGSGEMYREPVVVSRPPSGLSRPGDFGRSPLGAPPSRFSAPPLPGVRLRSSVDLPHHTGFPGLLRPGGTPRDARTPASDRLPFSPDVRTPGRRDPSDIPGFVSDRRVRGTSEVDLAAAEALRAAQQAALEAAREQKDAAAELRAETLAARAAIRELRGATDAARAAAEELRAASSHAQISMQLLITISSAARSTESVGVQTEGVGGRRAVLPDPFAILGEAPRVPIGVADVPADGDVDVAARAIDVDAGLDAAPPVPARRREVPAELGADVQRDAAPVVARDVAGAQDDAGVDLVAGREVAHAAARAARQRAARERVPVAGGVTAQVRATVDNLIGSWATHLPEGIRRERVAQVATEIITTSLALKDDDAAIEAMNQLLHSDAANLNGQEIYLLQQIFQVEEKIVGTLDRSAAAREAFLVETADGGTRSLLAGGVESQFQDELTLQRTLDAQYYGGEGIGRQTGPLQLAYQRLFRTDIGRINFR